MAELDYLTRPQGQVLILRPEGDALAVPEALAALLPQMRRLASTEEHARGLGEALSLGAEEIAALRAELEALAQAGLLLEEGEIRRALAALPAADRPPPMERIQICTRDRPELLPRCLQSVQASLQAGGRSAQVVVHDDARSPTALPGGARVVGRAERRGWARRLGARGVDPELAAWALLGEEELRTTGATMNAALLAGAGELYLSLDDDVALRFGDRRRSEGLALSSEGDPTEISFHATRAEARASAELQVLDALALHESLLGRELGALAAGAALALEGIDPAALGRLLRLGARVRVSMAGYAGDSGMGSTTYYLSRRGVTRAALLARYSVYKHTRELVRSVRQPTVSTGRFLMTGCAGFDHRTLLPPFFPVLRNPDGLFAATLRAMDPTACIGHLPWVVEHDPEARSSSMESAARVVASARVDELLYAAIDGFLPGLVVMDPGARLRMLGEHLAALGALPLADFRALMRRERCAQLLRLERELEALLEEHRGEPEAWAEDVRRVLEALEQGLGAPGLIEPLDLGLEPAQRALGRYGALLLEWPAIIEAVRTMRQEGAPLLEASVPT